MNNLTAEISKKCRKFVLSRWGKDGVEQVMERPVTWALYEANPQLKSLRRKQKHLPLIAIRGEISRIRLELSTERRQRSPA